MTAPATPSRESSAVGQATPARPPGDLRGKKLGRYEVLAELASGGMATVYVARAQGVAGFERLVAIKVLHPHLAHDDDFISMFLDEARLAARIRHPNVVSTLDVSDSEGDGYFLVMEYVEGDHLAALLSSSADVRVPAPVVLRVIIDSLEGLAAAHSLTDQNGQPLALVHRDISPHNILIGVDGVARITDFGVAKAKVRLAQTRTGHLKGKLAYVAPEQISDGRADQRSDLFSMGVVLWESLAGRRLFRGETDGELVNRLLHSPIPRLSDCVPRLAPFDEVMKRALSRDPAERFRSASDFVEAIEAAAPSIGGVASARKVGKAIRQRRSAKLEAERVRLFTSIDSLGRTVVPPREVVPRPGRFATPMAPLSAQSSEPETLAAAEHEHEASDERRDQSRVLPTGKHGMTSAAEAGNTEMDECTIRYAGGKKTAAPDGGAPPYELLAMTRRTPPGIEWRRAFGASIRGERSGPVTAARTENPTTRYAAVPGAAVPIAGATGSLERVPIPFVRMSKNPSRTRGLLQIVQLDAPFEAPAGSSAPPATSASHETTTPQRARGRFPAPKADVEPATSDRPTEFDLPVVDLEPRPIRGEPTNRVRNDLPRPRLRGEPTHRVRNDAPDSAFPPAPRRKSSARVVVLAIVLGLLVLASAGLFRAWQLGDGASLATITAGLSDATDAPPPPATTEATRSLAQTSEAP